MINEKNLIDRGKITYTWWELPDGKFSDGVTLQSVINSMPTVDAIVLPPIKIGDTAYFIIDGKIYTAVVYLIRWEQHKTYGIHSEISANVSPYSTVGASFNDFGKTVFCTREEAEAALAKMDKEKE